MNMCKWFLWSDFWKAYTSYELSLIDFVGFRSTLLERLGSDKF